MRGALLSLFACLFVAGLASADEPQRADGPSAACIAALGEEVAAVLHETGDLAWSDAPLRGYFPGIVGVISSDDALLGNEEVRPLVDAAGHPPFPAVVPHPPIDLDALGSSQEMHELRTIANSWPMDAGRRVLAEMRCGAGWPVEVLLVSSDERRALVADRVQNVYSCDIRSRRRTLLRDVVPVTEVRVFDDVESVYVRAARAGLTGTTFAIPSGVVRVQVREFSQVDIVARTFFHTRNGEHVGEIRELDTGRLRARVPFVRRGLVATLVAPSGRRVLRRRRVAPCQGDAECMSLTPVVATEATLDDGTGRVLARFVLPALLGDDGVEEAYGFSVDETRIVRSRGHEVHVFDTTTGATVLRSRCE